MVTFPFEGYKKNVTRNIVQLLKTSLLLRIGVLLHPLPAVDHFSFSFLLITGELVIFQKFFFNDNDNDSSFSGQAGVPLVELEHLLLLPFLQPLFLFSFIRPLAGAVELEVDAAIIEEKLDLTSCILPASTLGSAGVLSISPLFPFSIIDGKFLEYLQIF